MAKKYTSIGGQALIEGIMMKSPEKTAIAVRTPDKSIDISYLEGKSVREKYKILNHIFVQCVQEVVFEIKFGLFFSFFIIKFRFIYILLTIIL